MSPSTRSLVNELSRWEFIAWDNEPDFLEKFCDGGQELLGVSWCAEKMRVYFFVDDFQQVTDSIPMGEWLEWLEEKAKRYGV